MKKSILCLSAILANIYQLAQAQDVGTQNREQIVVTEVVDGDTIDATLLEQKKSVRIRLANIDCAEKSKKSGNFNKQLKEWQLSEKELKELGKESKANLEALITLNSKEIYFEETPDKVCNGEKRLVGILWTGDGKNINDYMLKKGGCKPYSCK